MLEGMASKLGTASGKILHNSFWYGLETIFETFVFIGTSIAVARYLGPTKLGYFSYINFFVAIVTRTSGTGLANATRKYMSEYLAAGDIGTARAVYHLAYKYQLLGALAITVLGLAVVLLFGDPAYRLMSVLLILAILPGVMSWVPANANQAFEDVSQNTFSAFCYILTYVAVIVLTVWRHWDLVGVASALLVGRTVEVVLRTIPLHRRLRTMPLSPLDKDLTARIRRFCIQSAGIQVLMAVVWDRSEMVFLRFYSGLEQIAFYSVSFTLANNLMTFPNVFGSATGITLMVEAGRDPARVRGLVNHGARFLLLVVLPVTLGAAAITQEAMRVTYGVRYAGAVPVLIVAAILVIPRAVQVLPETLLRTADQQNQMLVWLTVTGMVNIGLDWILIPRFGAVGAAWGNGVSQAFGVVALWWRAKQFYNFDFPWVTALRLGVAAGGMGAVSWWMIHRLLHGIPGLIATVLTAAVVYIVLVKVLGGLDASDRVRLAPIGSRLPGPFRGLFDSILQFATPAEAKPETAV
jgi:O-antigen/teichoic acid export membrane protein